MKMNWISLVGCLAFAASQTGLMAQDDETSPAVSAEPTPAAAVAEAPVPAEAPATDTIPVRPSTASLRPIPELVESTALGFRRVTGTGGFANAERTMVRVAQGGRIVQTRRVGEGGVAQVSDVAPGAYSIFANGSEGFAAYGTYLGDTGHSTQSRVGLIPQRDSQIVRRLIQTNLNSNSQAAAPEKVARDFAYENSDFEILADGTVNGRVAHAAPENQDVRPIAQMFVAFVQGGQIVAETRTNANGEFVVSGLTAGIYSFLVSGQEGFACFSSAVVHPESHVQARGRQLQFVSFNKAVTVTAITPVSPLDFNLFNQIPNTPTNSNSPAPGAGGGFGGGGGAAGGGGGGGFGGGGLLGALAGAGIGGALAGIDNGNGPSTPAAP